MNIDFTNLENNRQSFQEYCKWLAFQYNSTLEGKYRIKYNLLYPLLYHPLSEDKKDDFFNNFIESLDISPIKSLTYNEVIFNYF